jgi:hypothetical protein
MPMVQLLNFSPLVYKYHSKHRGILWHKPIPYLPLVNHWIYSECTKLCVMWFSWNFSAPIAPYRLYMNFLNVLDSDYMKLVWDYNTMPYAPIVSSMHHILSFSKVRLNLTKAISIIKVLFVISLLLYIQYNIKKISNRLNISPALNLQSNLGITSMTLGKDQNTSTRHV